MRSLVKGLLIIETNIHVAEVIREDEEEVQFFLGSQGRIKRGEGEGQQRQESCGEWGTFFHIDAKSKRSARA